MASAVVILGAGASADFGVPTLANIFKDSHARSYLQSNRSLLRNLNDVFWTPRGHTLDTSEDSVNIEQMLTILKDITRDDNIPDNAKPRNVDTFRKGLLCLVQKAIFDGKSSRSEHLNGLIDICDRVFSHTTWASFNWDCIFESSFYYRIPYGSGRMRHNPSLAIEVDNWRSGTRKHTYLKLHGGINWWLIDDRITYLPWSGQGDISTKWLEYERNNDQEGRPVILEPSFYKYDEIEYRQLRPQWDEFTRKLLQADCIIIVGYSMPEMDTNARAKILTAFHLNRDARWLVIDPSESVCNLYRRLLGSIRVVILGQSLAGFNNEMVTHLQTAFPSIDF